MRCSNCGVFVDDDEDSTCSSCEEDFCEDCMSTHGCELENDDEDHFDIPEK